MIDNYDSFTYNLYHLIAEVAGIPPLVLPNNHPNDIDIREFDAILISPGPGRPDRTRDFGISRQFVDCGLPVLGVCLGHQGIAIGHGGTVDRAPAPVHGRLSDIHHAGDGLFSGIPSPFRAVRYHSLLVTRLPPTLLQTAWTNEGLCMGLRHVDRPIFGLQFHPEAICTEYGRVLIENFLALARTRAARTPTVRPRRIADREPAYSLLSRKVGSERDCESVFSTLYAESEHAFWLDSSAVISGISRFSFMGDASGPHAELITYDANRKRVAIDRHGQVEYRDETIFDYLRRSLRQRRMINTTSLPFNLGYVGYLGYEVLRGSPESRTPDAALIFSDRMIAYDHAENTFEVLALCTPETEHETRRWLEVTVEKLGSRPSSTRVERPATRRVAIELRLRHPAARYLELIERCKDELRAGESYEVCLTNMIETQARIDPLTTYLELRRSNPAPFAAYFRRASLAVLGASPERFLCVSADGCVESKPIKGTARRGETPEIDLAIRDDLQSSEKERSENLMIVDLVRHDLGRVCAPGSVHVSTLFGVETYATVHQLVSTIRGRLADGYCGVDCVEAAFPGGSMTGAPKLRTIEIIERIEGGPRGVYSGAMGYFALSGAIDLNIVIRSIVVNDDRVSFGTGGAIVAMSDAAGELEETWLKARALVRALETTALDA